MEEYQSLMKKLDYHFSQQEIQKNLAKEDQALKFKHDELLN